jgi:triacylglycerol esterase/lipase EstA (alpha/beta hydrolase family)
MNKLLRPAFVGVALTLFLIALTGCAPPITATKATMRDNYREVSLNALSDNSYSSESRLVLYRFDLVDKYQKDPEATLKLLHEKASRDERRDLLYALAELNYLRAERLERKHSLQKRAAAHGYYLSSAIYAYLYLFGPGNEPPPDSFDRRFRTACDLYNRGLAHGLLGTNGAISEVELRNSRYELPPGPLNLQLKPGLVSTNFSRVVHFLPADDYKVRGLTVRDRQSGAGAPLIGVLRKGENQAFTQMLSVTAFLKCDGTLSDWSAGRLNGVLELHTSGKDRRSEVGGEIVPMQTDDTATTAYGLSDKAIWKLGSAQFFSAKEKVRSDVYLTHPYVAGRVPVIFVHGTFSSPVWWAEMWNTLRSDARLRESCQFWYFIYNSGNPITATADRLRSSILKKIEELDPEGKDPALRRMVVIGHSQGGLLAKLTATDTGDELWHAVTDKPVESLELQPQVKEALRRNLFFKPLPCVDSVVFIATPHRGSALASNFIRKIARKFMDIPQSLSNKDIRQLKEQLNLPPEVKAEVPTSLDGMSPDNKFLKILAEIPVSTNVTAHSIIAIKGKSQPPEGGDGVVKYTSAHVDYVASEFVVRSGHTCQDKPATIEEVRRILLEHLGANTNGLATNGTARH